MGERYRSWEERREIIRAVLADSASKPLSSFKLTASEEIYFRSRTAKAVHELAKQTSGFRAYYALPTAHPFYRVVFTSAAIIAVTVVAGIVVWFRTSDEPAYPVFAALMTIAAVAAGWWVIGGINHTITVRQNTNNMLFARFAQAPFSDSMHKFHYAFGYDVSAKVTREMVIALRDSGDAEKLKCAASVAYLLNYFEFIASAVMCGDFDKRIVDANIRGLVVFYYDKCEPYIRDANRANPKIYEHLIKLRTHYREP